MTIKAAVAGKSFEAYFNMLLADKMGEFKKENLTVETSVLPVPEMVAMLISGAIDVAPLGANAGPLNAISSGAHLKIVAAMPTFRAESKQGIWVRSALAESDGTVDPCALKNATVSLGAALLSNTVTLPLSRFLSKCNLTLKDVKPSPLGGPDALIALENGTIDAAFLADPAWADPDKKGYAKLAVPFGTFSINGYMMNDLPLKQPDVADAFVRAMVRTSRSYLQGNYRNDPTVRAALIEITGTTEQALDASVPLVFDPDLRFRSTAEVAEIQQVWIDAGDILSYKEPIPADRLVDNTLLDRVLSG